MSRRHIVSLAAALLMLCMASPAFAGLSLDDIKEMAAVGVPDSIIIQTIGNSAEVFNLSSDEIINLKKAGISDAVLEALQATAGSVTRSSDRERSDEGDRDRRNSRDDRDDDRDSRGRSDSRRDRDSRSDRDDAADARRSRRSAEKEEDGLVRRRRGSRSRSSRGGDEQDRGTRKGKRRKRVKRTPAEVKSVISSYKEGKFSSCILKAHKVLESNKYPEQDAKLNFYMGACLYNSKFLHGAQHYFDRVVSKGPAAGAYYSKSLINLIHIADETHDPIYLIKKVVNKIDPDDYPGAVKDDLYYYQGVRDFEGDNHKAARRNFAKVAPTSEKYIQARYYLGVIYNKERKYKQAVNTFAKLVQGIAAGRYRGSPELRASVGQLSYMGIARIYYGIQQYHRAADYYNKLPRESIQWATGQYESAWAYFMADGEQNKALGHILTVTSPFYEDLWIPEVKILEALTYYSICEYKQVQTLLDDFKSEYGALRDDVENLLSDYAEGGRPVRDLYKRLYGKKSKDWRIIPASIYAKIEADRGFSGPHNRVLQIETELKMLRTSRSQFRESEAGRALKTLLKKERKRYMKVAGISLANQLGQIQDQINGLLGQEALLRFEVVNGEYEKWQKAFRNPTQTDVDEKVQFDFATNPDVVYWPFNNEFWQDELGYYEKAEPGDCKE